MFTIDHPDLIPCSFMGNSICLKMVKCESFFSQLAMSLYDLLYRVYKYSVDVSLEQNMGNIPYLNACSMKNDV